MSSLVKIFDSIFESSKFNYQINDVFEKASYSLKFDEFYSISSITSLEDYLSSYNDDWTLFILLNGVSISSFDFKNIQEFVESINQNKLFTDDLLELKLEIYKSDDSTTVNVYNSSSFEEWIKSRSALEVLNVALSQIKRNGYINFNYIDDPSAFLFSKRIRINSTESVPDLPRAYLEYFNFNQNTEYPFIATDFEIENTAHIISSLFIHLGKLQNLFSLTSLFDNSYLDNEILNFQLKGYKFLKSKVRISDLNKDYDTYSNITSWVYSENANIPDKLGISRNILSLEINNDNLIISNKVFQSILSAHKIYLKENVAKYLEVRNKINNDVNEILKEIRSSLQELSQNYQKSNFLYLSFFISVFVLRTLMKNDFENIFTTDATIIFFLLLSISFIYLAYTIWVVCSLRNRVKKRYENVKNKNLDVLNKNDIERILNNDSEFDDEIANFNLKLIIYIILWILTMGVLTIAVAYMSEVY